MRHITSILQTNQNGENGPLSYPLQCMNAISKDTFACRVEELLTNQRNVVQVVQDQSQGLSTCYQGSGGGQMVYRLIRYRQSYRGQVP